MRKSSVWGMEEGAGEGLGEVSWGGVAVKRPQLLWL